MGFETDGLSTEIPGAWTLLIDVTLGGTALGMSVDHGDALDATVFVNDDCQVPAALLEAMEERQVPANPRCHRP